MKLIETQRLIMRPLEQTDFDDFLEYIMDKSLSRIYGLPIEKDRNLCYKIFSSFLSGDKTYALEHKGDKNMIGHLMIVPPELPGCNEADLSGKRGITLAFAVSAQYQRQGFMIEALHAIIEELFIVQKYDYIHCGYFEFNTPSKILQEKLGFTYYGFHTTKNGEVKIIDNLLFRENEHCIEL